MNLVIKHEERVITYYNHEQDLTVQLARLPNPTQRITEQHVAGEFLEWIPPEPSPCRKVWSHTLCPSIVKPFSHCHFITSSNWVVSFCRNGSNARGFHFVFLGPVWITRRLPKSLRSLSRRLRRQGLEDAAKAFSSLVFQFPQEKPRD